MTPGTTIPAALVGVWDGARVWMDGSDLDTDHGIVCERATDGRWWVTFPRHHLSAAGPDHREIGLSRMTLDLTHRMTRMEVVARLGARVGADVSEGVLWFRSFGRRVWNVDSVAGATGLWGSVEDGAASVLPTLADLDPTDDTRLPDGARVVDVRALAIVCQHVFGGPS